ncbi:hypothetical protein H6P81_011639 [Aristolochia fimbriata]|uniref:Glycoside hydrolase family 5 domain-containing protein n=1 Tax=Aristolochia fimbriata TaxID=158543 RepID=A0AAV7ECE5_ARIFI|nr:hypothetical protein H6P81_011639 [Aristolochia fimbriata]
METMLAEGLDRKHVGDIASGVASLGFNCVRLTWATFMFTRTHQLHASISDDLRISTVGESLRAHGLGETTLVNVTKHNPFMINLTLVEAYDEVVDALGAAGLMVVLDNHVSRPQWCCAEDDGNGFFGDEHFDPEEWLQGLVAVAKRFRRKTQVVGMSLRNELRGQRQSESDWYKYMELGAAKEKLVYEAHWYAFSEGQRHEWEERSPNRVCADSIARFESKVGFVVLSRRSPAAAPAPLFVSEFGVDQRGVNRADNRFLACFLAYAVSRDLDWALWALQGSYYLRKGRPGFDETYGVVDTQWDQPRNPNFLQTFRLPHQMIKAVKDEDEDEDKSSGSSTSIVRVTDSCGSGSEEGKSHLVNGDESLPAVRRERTSGDSFSRLLGLAEQVEGPSGGHDQAQTSNWGNGSYAGDNAMPAEELIQRLLTTHHPGMPLLG